MRQCLGVIESVYEQQWFMQYWSRPLADLSTVLYIIGLLVNTDRRTQTCEGQYSPIPVQ